MLGRRRNPAQVGWPSLGRIATGSSRPDRTNCSWSVRRQTGFGDRLGIAAVRAHIRPITRNRDASFEGQEYLGIYPYIDEAPSTRSTVEEIWVNKGSTASRRWALGSAILVRSARRLKRVS